MKRWLESAAHWLDERAMGMNLPFSSPPIEGYDTLLLLRFGITLPWWSLPRRELARDCTVAWWHPTWWTQTKWRVLGPLFRVAVRSGVWQVKHPFGRYVEGRLRWPDMWTRMEATR